MSRRRDHHTALAVAFGAGCNAALTVVLVKQVAGDGVPPWSDLPLGLAIIAAAGAAIGLVAHGAAMNNMLDRHRDATMSGTRPSASTGPDVLSIGWIPFDGDCDGDGTWPRCDVGHIGPCNTAALS